MNTVRGRHLSFVGNPWHGIRDLLKEMDRVADSVTANGLRSVYGRAEAWRPATDVSSHEEGVVIRCDLAGARPEEVELTFLPGRLVITGTCQTDPHQGAVFHGPQRCTGRFRREILLDAGVTDEDIRAELHGDLLEIRVDRRAEPSVDVPIPISATAGVPAPREPVADAESADVPQQV